MDSKTSLNRIKEVLEIKGIKQTWLAEKLGKGYNMVNAYVQNRRQPSLDDLFRIARILDVDVKDLLQPSKKEVTGKIVVGETVKIPLLGDVACGLPILASENIVAEIPVSVDLVKPNQKYFILRATGDSMDEAGIMDGDLVLIRQQQVAENGDRVVALIDDEATIKEYYRKGDMVVLKPKSRSPNHQPIILTSDFRIQGVVEMVIPS